MSMMRGLVGAAGMAGGIAATLIVRGGDPMEITGLIMVSLALVLAAVLLPPVRRRADREATR